MLEAINQRKTGSLFFRFENQQLPKSTMILMKVSLEKELGLSFSNAGVFALIMSSSPISPTVLTKHEF